MCPFDTLVLSVFPICEAISSNAITVVFPNIVSVKIASSAV